MGVTLRTFRPNALFSSFLGVLDIKLGELLACVLVHNVSAVCTV
jgi:hypothetical protein